MLSDIGAHLQKENVRLFFLNGFAFLLPFYQGISTIFLFIWVTYSLIAFDKRAKVARKQIAVPVLLFSLYALSVLFSDNISFQHIERKLSLVALPLVFVLNESVVRKKFSTILHFFVLGCAFSLLYCEVNALYNTIHYWWKSKNFFLEKKFSELHQTVYFAMYILMAILILIYLPFRRRWMSSFLVFFFIIGLFQISNRASIVILFLLALLHIPPKIKGFFRITSTITVVVFFSLVVLATTPRWRYTLKEVVQYGISITSNNDALTSYNLRLISWNASLGLIKEHFVLGLGAGGSQTALNKVYQEQGYSEAFEQQLNPHNTYFSLILETGVAGLALLFLYFFNVYKLTHTDPALSLFYVSFILLLAINFLFESMFNRYSGLIFINFFYCLFLTGKMGKTCNA